MTRPTLSVLYLSVSLTRAPLTQLPVADCEPQPHAHTGGGERSPLLDL